jgi:hypothetical protein
MNELGPVTEHEMILAFIKAEVDSARFGGLYQSCFAQLEQYGFKRQILVNTPDLHNGKQNAIRKTS